MKISFIRAVAALACSLLLIGCTTTQRYTAGGATIGSLAGLAIGGTGGAAAIGAVAGGGVGYAVGKSKQRRRAQRYYRRR